MTVAVITPPAPIISAAEARSQLSIGPEIADDILDALIAAATEVLDGPDGWLGRALGEQTLEQRHSGLYWVCSPVFMLYYPPLIEVVSVKYRDPDGVEQTVDPADYRVIGGAGATGIARLAPTYGTPWPRAQASEESVRITFRAGYPVVDGKSTVPAPIRHAVQLGVRELLDVGRELFLKREDVEGVLNREWVVSEAAGKVIGGAVEKLLSPYRVWMS
ncbi:MULTISPECIES: hypothetical protein [unclassified Chelatococcus]|uniref:head-tail connector protein n=1 Tax=unclassified Chelatococcus TaxID=2638111 RepID=UPI001BCEAF52|nr:MULTISPECIES: hypothetical protein [unclassified Chelatococcus]CAH1670737.1 conserved hypothetical protein [Hyphomicrobiales bacterium]MBS7738374.1 hypothetical protein [Chelatococcus sp. HY11]MBX3547357.1 hypothetical protein [Chelatococcus sp.]MCO5077280.1 hypothetical protein [Chelatococcus sp.]CAH1677037.1 conserved hypothetical protein [Hyphomicrobiales bacterium]